MIIIGVDYHPSDQYIAFVDTETGEYGERQLNHSAGEDAMFAAMSRLGGHKIGHGEEMVISENRNIRQLTQ